MVVPGRSVRVLSEQRSLRLGDGEGVGLKTTGEIEADAVGFTLDRLGAARVEEGRPAEVTSGVKASVNSTHPTRPRVTRAHTGVGGTLNCTYSPEPIIATTMSSAPMMIKTVCELMGHPLPRPVPLASNRIRRHTITRQWLAKLA
jgi:hypothetical protein